MTNGSPIADKLKSSSRELLDLTARNRLINTPRTRTKSSSIEIIDADANAVYTRLVCERKSMTFAAGLQKEIELSTDADEGPYHLDQPDEDEQSSTKRGSRRTESLQTRLTSEVLQRRLLRLFLDARTYEEEQGVNILFLAIGFLKWYESPVSDQPRFAPLVLVPAQLERQSSRSKFKITALEGDISTNLSLKERLREFNIELPNIPEVDEDELVVADYFELVKRAIVSEPRWEVLPNDIVLWFFSFTKFLMYRDLQADTWPEDESLVDRDLIQGLIGAGFGADQPLCGDDDPVEQFCPPEQCTHIVDADSSQALAIEEVRRGRHLVIQGPPGTGKSQTIANLIASAVKDGKKVLFVAEKMAALEVVKGRLDRCGLGPICLELHSNKANKKAVLLDLAETLDSRRPKIGDLEEQCDQLRLARERLNQHSDSLHSPFGKAAFSPYFIMGRLVRLAGKGVRPPRFRLAAATTWTARQIKDKAAIIHDLSLHVEKVGVPQSHPWRGVNAEPLLPSENDRVLERIGKLLPRLTRLLNSTIKLGKCLCFRLFPSVTQIELLTKTAEHLVLAPTADVGAVADEIWTIGRAAIDSILDRGKKYAECHDRLSGSIEDEAWDLDVAGARKQLSLRGKSMLRFLRRDYRDAIRTLEKICVDRPPGKLQERLEKLDTLVSGQRARNDLLEDIRGPAIGMRAFGGMWNGLASDWSQLQAIHDWIQRGEEQKVASTFRQLLDAAKNSPECGQYVQQINAESAPILDALTSLFADLRLDLSEAFGIADLRSLSLRSVHERLESWLQHPAGLENWTAFQTRWRRLADEQLDELAKLIDDGTVAAADAVDQYHMSVWEEIMRSVYREFPNLAEFNGVSHDEIVTQFRNLDRGRIELARREVALAHYRGLPHGDSDVGEMAIVRHEIQKKSRHLPLRKLVANAGRVIQQIKPVFLMSPLSIAQFLHPGAVEFDMLVIDEASQIRPVDALGAIARCKQIVVVGDDKQLPPTTFFEKLTGSVESNEADEDDAQAADLESVLGLCLSRNITQRMLRWHYRSRHHTLIAVSNHEFYNDRLYIVPSPSRHSTEMGLFFRRVANGIFDRGKTATNRVEAKAVASAMIDHARKSPHLTLGVGTFSVAQRDAIRDELELLLRENTDVDRFFSKSDGEPYFIKNLESLQGDERDVIYISVGYGKDDSGFFGMSFGPLAKSGGERRLNVLISRARVRCEVFASITADDIDLNRAHSRGAAALKCFLKYAQSGILDAGRPTDRECDSDFELEVKRAVEQQGYTVDPQVGVAGFFVDLAVQDPEQPGRYLIGVECDGATYHSSRSARDRDRLRQQVLEDREWVIHRIWSTDWFKRPAEQLRRLLDAIERAKIGNSGDVDLRNSGIAVPDEGQPIEFTDINFGDVDLSDMDLELPLNDNSLDPDSDSENLVDNMAGGIVIPYQEAEPTARVDQQLHLVPVQVLAKVAIDVVRVEAPIHRDEVARRIASLWGHQRVSARMSSSVFAALNHGVRKGELEARGKFYCLTGHREISVRSRDSVLSATLRLPEMLPPDEVRMAVVQIVHKHLGVGNEEIVGVTSRLFGFRSTGPKVRQVIESAVSELVIEGRIRLRDERLYIE